jgi:hypothetical protein
VGRMNLDYRRPIDRPGHCRAVCGRALRECLVGNRASRAVLSVDHRTIDREETAAPKARWIVEGLKDTDWHWAAILVRVLVRETFAGECNCGQGN